MSRAMLILLAAGLAPAAAAPAGQKALSPQRAVPDAGWAAVPIPADTGKNLYERYCNECHGEGPDKPGTVALEVKYKGALPGRLDRRTDLDPAYVAYVVRNGVSVMPSMRKTEISDAELKAISDYLAARTKD